MRLTHVRLLVSDYPTCFVFYRDVLKFPVTFGDETSGYADFEAGGAALALFSWSEMATALGTAARGETMSGDRDHVTLVFAVENVDAACTVLAKRGVALAMPAVDHPDWGIRTAHFRDPDGNLIEIYQSLQ